MFWTYNNNRSSPHSFISVGTQANGVSIRLLVCAHPDDQGHQEASDVNYYYWALQHRGWELYTKETRRLYADGLEVIKTI